MVNLATIEAQLNSDAAAMTHFLQDPISYLAKEGLTISAEMGDELRAYVAKQPDLKKRGIKGKIILGIISNNSAGIMEE